MYFTPIFYHSFYIDGRHKLQGVTYTRTRYILTSLEKYIDSIKISRAKLSKNIKFDPDFFGVKIHFFNYGSNGVALSYF